nr:hypothetical protein CFP56_78774 [Quercus suber]
MARGRIRVEWTDAGLRSVVASRPREMDWRVAAKSPAVLSCMSRVTDERCPSPPCPVESQSVHCMLVGLVASGTRATTCCMRCMYVGPGLYVQSWTYGTVTAAASMHVRYLPMVDVASRHTVLDWTALDWTALVLDGTVLYIPSLTSSHMAEGTSPRARSAYSMGQYCRPTSLPPYCMLYHQSKARWPAPSPGRRSIGPCRAAAANDQDGPLADWPPSPGHVTAARHSRHAAQAQHCSLAPNLRRRFGGRYGTALHCTGVGAPRLVGSQRCKAYAPSVCTHTIDPGTSRSKPRRAWIGAHGAIRVAPTEPCGSSPPPIQYLYL